MLINGAIVLGGLFANETHYDVIIVCGMVILCLYFVLLAVLKYFSWRVVKELGKVGRSTPRTPNMVAQTLV